MIVAIGCGLFGSRSFLCNSRWLGPAAAAQGAISPAVHARYQRHADNDGAGSHEHDIAVEDDRPEGAQQ